LCSKCGVSPASQRLSNGYPPKEVTNLATDVISTIFKSGDSLVLEEIKDKTAPAPTLTEVKSGFPSGSVLKRVMADDNSCLFHAISYCLEKNSNKVTSLRKIISDAVLNDPINYNQAILQKTPVDYSKWIQQSTSWGGSVELQILSSHFKVQIMAYDVTRNRGNCFGEDSPFTQRIYVIYDGIHYDCLVWNTSQNKENDVTIFGIQDNYMEQGCIAFVDAENKKGRFVDEYNYKLKCGTCKQVLVGNAAAIEHSKKTGHTDFGQT